MASFTQPTWSYETHDRSLSNSPSATRDRLWNHDDRPVAGHHAALVVDRNDEHVVGRQLSRRLACCRSKHHLPGVESWFDAILGSVGSLMEINPSKVSAWRNAISTLNPAYFALVMATGIVSVACHLMDLRLISQALFYVNIGAFLVLVILSTVRMVAFPRELFTDLMDHKRGVGFFTTVAACCVLGVQFLSIAKLPDVSIVLWGVGVALWFVLTYIIFTSFAVKQTKPSLAEGIHGGWLVSVVAAQAVSLLGGMLAERFGAYREIAIFFSLTMWLGGGMLYIWIISLIFYRYSFFPMSATEMSPPYWINMGAMAISTLAGVSLISLTEDSPILIQVLPFAKGFSLMFWATATWWIPMLVTLGVWRHGYMRVALTYDPQYWSIVFPLGMYTVCTYRLANELDLPFLLPISHLFIYIALVAWTLTFTAMMRSFWRMRRLT